MSAIPDGVSEEAMSSSPNEMLRPLPAREKLGDEVARALRKLIMAGVYTAGEKMRVQELAARLGVSTQPVREALITLSNEGLLDVLPHRGFRVTTVYESDLVDVFRVHAFVAGSLAAKAAEVITPDQIDRLRQQQDEMERSASIADFDIQSARVANLNFEFHRSINGIPEANRLRWFLRAATRYIPEELYSGWLTSTIDEHPPIIAALAAHDARRARDLVERHVVAAGDIVVARMTTNRPPDAPLNGTRTSAG